MVTSAWRAKLSEYALDRYLAFSSDGLSTAGGYHSLPSSHGKHGEQLPASSALYLPPEKSSGKMAAMQPQRPHAAEPVVRGRRSTAEGLEEARDLATGRLARISLVRRRSAADSATPPDMREDEPNAEVTTTTTTGGSVSVDAAAPADRRASLVRSSRRISNAEVAASTKEEGRLAEQRGDAWAFGCLLSSLALHQKRAKEDSDKKTSHYQCGTTVALDHRHHHGAEVRAREPSRSAASMRRRCSDDMDGWGEFESASKDRPGRCADRQSSRLKLSAAEVAAEDRPRGRRKSCVERKFAVVSEISLGLSLERRSSRRTSAASSEASCEAGAVSSSSAGGGSCVDMAKGMRHASASSSVHTLAEATAGSRPERTPEARDSTKRQRRRQARRYTEDMESFGTHHDCGTKECAGRVAERGTSGVNINQVQSKEARHGAYSSSAQPAAPIAPPARDGAHTSDDGAPPPSAPPSPPTSQADASAQPTPLVEGRTAPAGQGQSGGGTAERGFNSATAVQQCHRLVDPVETTEAVPVATEAVPATLPDHGEEEEDEARGLWLASHAHGGLASAYDLPSYRASPKSKRGSKHSDDTGTPADVKGTPADCMLELDARKANREAPLALPVPPMPLTPYLLMLRVCQGKVSPLDGVTPSCCPRPLLQLATQCCALPPQERPGLAAVLEQLQGKVLRYIDSSALAGPRRPLPTLEGWRDAAERTLLGTEPANGQGDESGRGRGGDGGSSDGYAHDGGGEGTVRVQFVP